MYEIRRTIKITEQLKLGDDVLDIVIAPEEIVKEYNRSVAGITKAQTVVNKAKQAGDPASAKAAVEQFGEAITQLMDVLLGNANTEKIIAFYDGNKIEMSSWITPFLTGVIAPKMKEAAEMMRQQVSRDYRKAGRKGLFRR